MQRFPGSVGLTALALGGRLLPPARIPTAATPPAGGVTVFIGTKTN
ncbi:MAG TPA: hypothetical protein VH158_06725 [Gemmatimonadales bacterium]|jgi:hypothetical protein|nr:hypothetical protein [Gemmatimonadales bacterium]